MLKWISRRPSKAITTQVSRTASAGRGLLGRRRLRRGDAGTGQGRAEQGLGLSAGRDALRASVLLECSVQASGISLTFFSFCVS